MSITAFLRRILPGVRHNAPLILLPNVAAFIRPTYPAKYHFVLDPGHGPVTPDKQSPPFIGGVIFKEAEGNRTILRFLREELDRIGVSYSVTNEPELQGDSLVERVRRANAITPDLPPVFISIHCNAAPTLRINGWTTVGGVETFHYPGSSYGKYIATILQKHLVRVTGRRDRGVKEATFYVLKHTAFPAVLGETLFMNNKEELSLLLNPAFMRKVAHGYRDAILEMDRDGIHRFE